MSKYLSISTSPSCFAEFEENILIACDDEPISKLDICIAAFESKYFGDSTPIPQVSNIDIAEIASN